MTENANTTNYEKCPRPTIGVYLDGELAAADESVLEAHLLDCEICRAELTAQKKMLCVLDFAMGEKEDFGVPDDFAKIVATRAESGVNGLRDHRERPTALFLTASLFVFALVGLGSESARFVGAFFGALEKTLAFVVSAASFVFDLSFGTSVILRTIGHAVLSHPAVVFAPAMILAGLCFLRVAMRFDSAKFFGEK